jgi:hypothetical protein
MKYEWEGKSDFGFFLDLAGMTRDLVVGAFGVTSTELNFGCS